MKQTIIKLINALSCAVLIFAICLTLFSVAAPRQAIATWDGSVAASFASGSGTASSPYVINTQAQLGYFVNQLAAGVTYEGMYIKLGKSLDMTGAVWDYEHGYDFMGIFDGQGYTITADCPFMGDVGAGGVVQGLNYVANMQVDRALICENNYGTINSCTARGNVHMDLSRMVYAGLICANNGSTGVITNCGAVGDLYAHGDDYSAYAAMVPKNSGTMSDCFSAVTLYAYGSGKYSEEKVCPLTTGYNPASNSFYDSSLYTGSAHCGLGLTTEVMKSSAFLDSLIGTSSPGTKWVTGSDGYPELAHCYNNYAYVDGYQDTDEITYHGASASLKIMSGSSCTRIYYTKDGTIPTTSSSYTFSGRSISVSDDTILTIAPYSTSYGMGTVTRYTITELYGSGTQSSPYQIYTKQQLDAVRVEPDKYYKLMNDLTYTDEDFAFGAVASGGWNSIGFSGYFDGNEKAITGLAGSQGGMFSNNSGTITSLRLVDHRLYGTGDFGALADNNSGTITRCYVKSAWTYDDLPPDRSPDDWWPLVGGIVGNNSSGTISYCRNDGLVVSFGAIRYGTVSVGGIAGDYGDIESCVNFGDLLILHNQHADEAYFAGFCADSYVTNCRGSADMLIQNSFDYPIQIGAITADNYQASIVQYCIADPYRITWDLIGGYMVPGSSNFSISQNNRYSYVLGENLSSAYPDLDFESNWMITSEGPMPQGVVDAAGHCWRLNGTVSEPSCTSSGKVPMICDLCGTTKTDYPSKVGHRYASYTSNGDATCLEDGTKTGTCVRCTATNTVADEGTALGHSFTDYVSDGNATCTEEGTQTAVCDRDNCAVTDVKAMDALGHRCYGAKSNVLKQAATCDKPAYFYGLCGVCGEVDYNSEITSGSALGHNWGTAWFVWNADLSSAYLKAECQRCGAGLTGSDCTITKRVVIELSCEIDGEITATASGTLNKKGYTETRTITTGTAPGHEYQSTVTAPTCLDGGFTTYTCVNCADAYLADPTDALDHSFTKYESNGDATCTNDGTKTAKCDRCTATDTITDEGSALDHSFTKYESNDDATCIADGTKTAKCDRCTETKTVADEGSALDHSFTKYASNGDATCTVDGTMTATCDRCIEINTRIDEGSMLGHSFTKYISDENATCIANGTETAMCDRCAETDTKEISDSALGHQWSQWITMTAATCLGDGEERRDCSACDAFETNPITGGSHLYGKWYVSTAATCTSDGEERSDCIYCDDYKSNFVQKYGHSFTTYVSDDNATCTANCTETAVCERCDETDTREIADSASVISGVRGSPCPRQPVWVTGKNAETAQHAMNMRPRHLLAGHISMAPGKWNRIPPVL